MTSVADTTREVPKVKLLRSKPLLMAKVILLPVLQVVLGSFGVLVVIVGAGYIPGTVLAYIGISLFFWLAICALLLAPDILLDLKEWFNVEMKKEMDKDV
jgi:hypothetical protein